MKKPKSILFVCTGNTCRSPMAEALFRHMLTRAGIQGITVWSRGVATVRGHPAPPEVRQALEAAGIPPAETGSTPLSQDDVVKADLILVMEEKHQAWIQERYPEAADKTFVLKTYTGSAGPSYIPDPLGGTLRDYEACRDQIQDCLLGLLPKVKREKTPSPAGRRPRRRSDGG